MKSGIINKDKNYSLHDTENYKKELVCTVSDVTSKYSLLIIEYFKFIQENIKVSSNNNLSKFIIIRGLDTITNVFLYILYYTKNIDLTYFHCQKSFYFYVEFVGQISEDEKTFLQLSSRDATTYVYKKTIFDINNEFKKNNDEISDYTRVKLDIINLYIDLYKTLLLKLINEDFTNLGKLNNIIGIYNKLNNLSDKSSIKLFNEIIDKLYFRIENVEYFFDLSLLLIKKIAKNHDLFITCINKILSDDFKDKVCETPDKLAIWLTN